MFYIGYTLYGYSKKEYGSTYYKLPWVSKLNSVLEYIENFSNKYLDVKKLCVVIEKKLCIISMYFERLWIKRNHLVDYGDKETYRILSPIIHNDIRNLCNEDARKLYSVLSPKVQIQVNINNIIYDNFSNYFCNISFVISFYFPPIT